MRKLILAICIAVMMISFNACNSDRPADETDTSSAVTSEVTEDSSVDPGGLPIEEEEDITLEEGQGTAGF